MAPEDSSAKKVSWRRGCGVTSLIGLIFFVGLVLFNLPYGNTTGLKIGPETTVIEGPILPDGRIDYIDELERRDREAATCDNNVLAALFPMMDRQYFGSDELSQTKYWNAFVEKLGFDAPQESSGIQHPRDTLLAKLQDGVVDEAQLEKISNDLVWEQQQIELAWPKGEFQNWAAELDLLKDTLDKIVAASTKSVYYHPVVVSYPGESAILAILPLASETLRFAELLQLRIFKLVGEQQVEKALSDLKAIRRFGYKMARGQTTGEFFLAMKIMKLAHAGEQAVLNCPTVTAEQLANYRKFMAKHRLLLLAVNSADRCQRFLLLDLVQSTKVFGFESLPIDFDEAPSFLPDAFINSSDLSETMRQINRHCDEVVACFGKLSWKKQVQSLENIDKAIRGDRPDVAGFILRGLTGSKRRGRLLAEYLLTAFSGPAANIPKFQFHCVIQDQVNMTGFGIQQYRLDRGKFPTDWSELFAPDFPPEMLTDHWNEQSFAIKETESGFVVYSKGLDGTDNEGRTQEEVAVSAESDIRIFVGQRPQFEVSSFLDNRIKDRKNSEMIYQKRAAEASAN